MKKPISDCWAWPVLPPSESSATTASADTPILMLMRISLGHKRASVGGAPAPRRPAARTLRRCARAPRFAQARQDCVTIEAHFHQRDLGLVDVRRHLITHLGLEHVKHGEPQRDSGQRARVGRITGDDGLGERLRALGVGSPQQDHHAVAVLVRDPLHRRLILQAHGARRRSDVAGGERQYLVGPRAHRALRDRGTRYAIALPERDDLLASKNHHVAPFVPFRSRTRESPSGSCVIRPRNRLPLPANIVRVRRPSVSPRRAWPRYGMAEAMWPWVGENPGMPRVRTNSSIRSRAISFSTTARLARVR